MMQVGGYHEYIGRCSVHCTLRFQYKSKAFINLLSHMNHNAPDVLMLTLQRTEHRQYTEHPPMY